MSSRFSRRGHINTSASDGRPLQIVYIHEEYDRKQHKVFDEVHALCQFAAAMTRGDLVSDFGNALKRSVMLLGCTKSGLRVSEWNPSIVVVIYHN